MDSSDSPPDADADAGPRGAATFVTTHWSVVLAARDQDSPHSAEALEELCRAYWYPLYAYVRRQGHSPHDAQDLTQEFFARLLHKDYLHAVAREKGRFRSFLLVALRRFLLNEWDRSRTQKRGGGQALVSLDTSTAERRYQTEPSPELPPDRIYERRWALTLLARSIARLKGEFARLGKAHEYEQLKGFLTAERGEINYASIARELRLSEGAARVAAHRLRKRFRELFREEIAHTVSAEELDDEIRHLMAVLGG
jgi:RNA polymerase sigma-70 factor (ECF subfamily)